MMTKRLKAADPTIVPGPNSPESNPLPKTSMMAKRISGAEEPRAIRVRLETVSFQMRTFVTFTFWKSVQ